MSTTIKPTFSILKVGIVISLLCFQSIPFAKSQSIQVSKQSQAKIKTPTLGQLMSNVEITFGEPLEKTASVGKPPITKWRYLEFSVYFESDKVIHAVIHHR